MTKNRDTERMLDAWLAEGFDVANDRILDLVEDRVWQERQRPAWRVSWRDTHVNGYFKLGIAAAAVLVIAVVGWNLLPGRTGPAATPSPSPSPTLGPSPTPYACEDDIAGCAGLLGAGNHQTAHFTPVFDYSTPEGWENTIDVEGLFTLWPVDAVYVTRGDLIMVWSDVVPADRPASCELGPAAGVDGSVEGWMTYLTNHPGLIASNVRTVDLSGSQGQSVDLRVNNTWNPDCFVDSAPLTAPLLKTTEGAPGDGYGLTTGVRMRLYAIQLGNQTVVVTTYIYGNPNEALFTAGVELAEAVIETFSWACKADSPAGPCWGAPDASGNPATPPPSP